MSTFAAAEPKVAKPVLSPEISRAIEVMRQADPRTLQAAGVSFAEHWYSSPHNDLAFLERNRDLWERLDEPEGIDWNLPGMEALAKELDPYVDELKDVPQESRDKGVFHWNNWWFCYADAVAMYGLVRHVQPRRYVEIGCGYSSLLLAKALKRNERSCDVTLVEPYPREELLSRLPGDWNIMRTPLQRAPLELFETLGPGDVLFFDGTHVCKTASDVNWLFFKVLPKLRPGVLIHLHDIFLPADYPAQWLLERGWSWNEQFLLQAFLMHNSAYKVLLCLSYLGYRAPETSKKFFRLNEAPLGASFWMIKQRMH